ncbi:MAG: hypothetical protein A2162_00820 [Deltaproteobacteria bacterium RBG_13_52_11b]|nr:MAG: hypothetical protein A2162_00820 [Deltaproteobacteria bacterium RBG_13_52_11b]
MLALFAGVDDVDAQTVRGRLYRQTPSGSYPASYVRLTLYNFGPDGGRSAPVYSGSDGTYYFNGIPPGDYTLEVWIDANRSMNFRLHVVNQPYTDIGPIHIP